MGEAEKKVEYYKVLTPPILVAMIILLVISEIFTIVFRSLTGKMWTYTGWFIGPIYIILILELLGRINPKFRLNPGQIFVLLLPIWFAAGKAFMITGAGGENWIEMLYPILAFVVRGTVELRDWTWDLTPGFIAPKDLTELTKAWRGLFPGETINWGVWIGPIAFWSTWLVVTTLMITIITFVLIGPHTVEVERLVFPMSVPATVLISNAGTWEDKKSKLFDFTDPKIKAFWVSFFIGALGLSLIPLIMEVMPLIPMWGAFLWGEIPIRFSDYTMGFLPGAYMDGILIIHQAILMTLLPYDVMITAILVWLVFYVIYTTVGVRMGFLEYSRGCEHSANWHFGNRPPFPMMEFGVVGLSLGLALITLYEARGAIKQLIKGEVKSELPVKQLLMVLGALFLIWLALWTAAGANPVIMIYFFILFILWQIAITRIYAEVWWHPPVMHDHYYLIIWPVGRALGVWGDAPAKSQALYITNMALLTHGCWAGFRQNPWNMGWQAHIYKWTKELKAPVKEIFLATVLIAVIGWPLAVTFEIWWLHHGGGYVKLNEGTYTWPVDVALNQGVRGLTHFETLLRMPFWYHGLLAILGIVVQFAIYFARMRFPWFFIHPTALTMTMWLPEFMWQASIVALVAKYIGIKVFGARRYEEYISYVAAGLCFGFGAGYLFGGFYDLFTSVIPKFHAFFVP